MVHSFSEGGCYIAHDVSDDLPARRLTAHEVERVLKRAIDLQHAGDPEREASYTVADVERVGAEIGVQPAAIQTALAQVQHEALAKPRAQPGVLDRVFGPEWVVAARTVPGPAPAVHAATGAMMTDQLFSVYRNLGQTVVWVPGTGWLHGVRRALDFSQRYRLAADMVVVTITDSLSQSGWCDVRMEAGLEDRRGSALRRAAAGPIVLGGGSALVAAGIGTASLAFAPVLLVGAVAGAATFLQSRRRYRRDAMELRQTLERFLDYLERERVP